jgi:glucose-1-phosphate cytidylyltransferase
MEVIILAGGIGSRLSEETILRPKPMVEIGGMPILWHIMKIYGHYGFNDFVVCLGYKGYVIKEFFSNYFLHTSDVTLHLAENRVEVHNNKTEPWRVTLVDTGQATQTGGRIKRVLSHVQGDEFFALTYGDGVADIYIQAQVQFHAAHGLKATVTAVRPSARFGAMQVANHRVTNFEEKPVSDGGWINGGFFLLSPSIGQLIRDDETVWEREPLEMLARSGELAAYEHSGFWHPMDTMRDRNFLEEQWSSGKAAWRVW